MKFPKEAWYDGNKAKQVYGDTYYVYRGCWNDPVYVKASKVINVPVFGAHIEGKEVNYNDVWDGYGENEAPTPEDIAYDVEELIYFAEDNL